MNVRNLIAAVLAIAVGGLALLQSADYPVGTLLRMGPGYFPSVLGALMIAFGGILLVQSIRLPPTAAPAFLLRPVVMIPLGIVLFAMLLERFGLAPATIALVFVSALSEPQFRPTRALALAAGMTALTSVVFIVILRLPFSFLRW